MRNFQQERKFKDILRSKPVLFFLFVLVLIFAWGVLGLVGKMETTRENRKIAENKVAELEKEKARLSSDIAKLGSPSGVEASIREKFGLVKDGEGVVIVVEDKNPPKDKEETSGFLNFLKNLFK